MYRHSGLLSKGKRRGGIAVYRHIGPLKVRGEVETQCTDTQDLYATFRGEMK